MILFLLLFYLFFSINYHGQPGYSEKRNSSPSGVVLCLMRIAFFFMMILFIVMVVVTGIYYVLDLTLQSSCRTVHDDQPYLINLISGKYYIKIYLQVEIYFSI